MYDWMDANNASRLLQEPWTCATKCEQLLEPDISTRATQHMVPCHPIYGVVVVVGGGGKKEPRQRYVAAIRYRLPQRYQGVSFLYHSRLHH